MLASSATKKLPGADWRRFTKSTDLTVGSRRGIPHQQVGQIGVIASRQRLRVPAPFLTRDQIFEPEDAVVVPQLLLTHRDQIPEVRELGDDILEV